MFDDEDLQQWGDAADEGNTQGSFLPDDYFTNMLGRTTNSLFQTHQPAYEAPPPPPEPPAPPPKLINRLTPTPPQPDNLPQGGFRKGRRPDTTEMPAISSLDSVVRSFGFDEGGGETTGPIENAGLRQFSATRSRKEEDAAFHDVLGAIQPTDAGQIREKRSAFDHLVASMGASAPGSGGLVGNRQDQMVDFVVTSGMDAVLSEIRNTREIEAPPEPPAFPMISPNRRSSPPRA